MLAKLVVFGYLIAITITVSANCQSSTLQGRRNYQEDRIICALDLRLPLSSDEPNEVEVSVIGIFDGHNGAEASEMASKLFLDYFRNHSKSISHETGFEILREALLRTIDDIDIAFTEEANRRRLVAGSTAVVVLIANGQILAANVGDSKAFICSSSTAKSALVVKELTKDHHLDRHDEKARVEAAGGFVVNRYGVPLINGGFVLSRAIGDVYWKRFGVISTPEITNWQAIGASDRYLVVSSDGMFESLSTDAVCDQLSIGSESDASSLADSLVTSAFQKGSRDNLSVVVIPLASNHVNVQDYTASEL